jgi:hypothetical protein
MSNIFNTFKQGSNLGMFNYGQPSAGSFENIEELISKLPADKQAAAREKQINAAIEAKATSQVLAPFQQPYTLEELGKFREQEARRAQELGKESVETAFKYGMLANIPKTISQSFGNISAMNLLAGQGIADTYARTLAAYPRPQFATANFQSQKYFE